MKHGITLLPVSLASPEKWEYSYDGQTFRMREWFPADMDATARDNTLSVTNALGVSPEIAEDGSVIIEMEASPESATRALLGEAVTQATIWGMLPLELQATILHHLLTYCSMPVPLPIPNPSEILQTQP